MNLKKNFLGHPRHIALARQAVRESLVLLKNNNKLRSFHLILFHRKLAGPLLGKEEKI